MKPKPYIIRGAYSVGSCIVKITYLDKYVIVKCKEMYPSLKRIENGLNGFIRGGANNPDGLYYFLYNYVKKHPDEKFGIELVLESVNAYELLKKEQELLDAGKKSKRLLNNQIEAYIPAYNETTGKYGWIDRVAYMNFKKWFKSRNKKPKASA